MSDVPHELFQRWLHSHEEDTPTEQIYRPSSFSFGPSRGRSGFELHADMSGAVIGIAAADGSMEQPCTWHFESNDEKQIVLTPRSGHSISFRILSLASHRLVVRKD